MKLTRIRMLFNFTDGNVLVKTPERAVKIGIRTKIGYSLLLIGAWIIFGHRKQFLTITNPQDKEWY